MSIQSLQAFEDYLTLTNVVFEYILNKKFKYLVDHLTLTNVVFE